MRVILLVLHASETCTTDDVAEHLMKHDFLVTHVTEVRLPNEVQR